MRIKQSAHPSSPKTKASVHTIVRFMTKPEKIIRTISSSLREKMDSKEGYQLFLACFFLGIIVFISVISNSQNCVEYNYEISPGQSKSTYFELPDSYYGKYKGDATVNVTNRIPKYISVEVHSGMEGKDEINRSEWNTEKDPHIVDKLMGYKEYRCGKAIIYMNISVDSSAHLGKYPIKCCWKWENLEKKIIVWLDIKKTTA